MAIERALDPPSSAAILGREESLWEIRARTFLHNRGAVISTVVLLLVLIVSFLAPVIAAYDPVAMQADQLLAPPSIQHLMGTDDYGRDILSRLVYGSGISFRVGFISVAFSASVGAILGLISGYYGGLTDTLIMRLIDVKLAFPGILLSIGIVAVMGPSILALIVALGIAGIAGYTRVVRATVLAGKELPYVEAAKVLGCGDARVMYAHILPNVLAPVIVLATLNVAGSILSASALSFIGIGAQPPTPEWGAMLAEGREFLDTAWWITTFPGLALVIVVISVNLIGDGLRDALDPRMKT